MADMTVNIPTATMIPTGIPITAKRMERAVPKDKMLNAGMTLEYMFGLVGLWIWNSTLKKLYLFYVKKTDEVSLPPCRRRRNTVP